MGVPRIGVVDYDNNAIRDYHFCESEAESHIDEANTSTAHI